MSLDPSKGIDYYAYLASNEFTAKFSKPMDWGKSTETVDEENPETMLSGNFQIYKKDIGIMERTGRFQWSAFQNEIQVDNKYAEIAPLTGVLGSSDMGDMMKTPSVIERQFALSYGFYDSGPGFGSLTNQDQSYVYITPPVSQWMTEVINSDSDLLKVPFKGFALSGAHDSGMNTTSTIEGILENKAFLTILSEIIGIDAALLADSEILKAVINFSITQKDTFTTLMNLGVRYFDFRPGYTYDNVIKGIFHEHSFIPGANFSLFLSEVLDWLAANPKEFVIINLNFSGFTQSKMKPSVNT